MNEVDKFFSDLPEGKEEHKFDINSALSQKEEPKDEESGSQSPVAKDETPVEDELPFAKNPKIQKFIQRQVKKQLEGLKGDTPEKQEVKETAKSTDMPAEWVLAYGDSEQSRNAWQLQQRLIEDAVQRAKDESVREIQSSFEQQKQQEKQYENFITNSLESIEDSHDVDLTSDAPAAKKLRSEFLEMVKTLSPKDSDGNVTEYADFDAVWNVFHSSRAKAPSETTSQKKAISSRSMTKSSEAGLYDSSAPRKSIGFSDLDWS